MIEEANWLTLSEDIEHLLDGGFDAVICLGNSFAHLMDTTGDQYDQRQAIRHFERCVKPGGLLLIDHRNFDHIVDTGSAPARCIYYNVSFINNSKRATNSNSLFFFYRALIQPTSLPQSFTSGGNLPL